MVLLKNKYGVALDGGPIAIFDEETCIGEALIDTVRPGDEKVICCYLFIPSAHNYLVLPSLCHSVLKQT